MIRPSTLTQLLRYSAVGLASNLFLYLAYLGLTASGLGHKTAMTSLYILGVLITFMVNRNWSFGHRGYAGTAFIRYAVANLLGYLLNFALLWIAVDQWHLPHQWVQLVAILLVAISVFLMQRYWVFLPEARHGTI
jgi:putative flippase GtrA